MVSLLAWSALALTVAQQTASPAFSYDNGIRRMAACDNVLIVANVRSTSRVRFDVPPPQRASRFHASVAEVVKSDDPSLNPYSEIDFQYEGGLLGYGAWNGDSRYLVCLNRDRSTGTLAPIHAFEVGFRTVRAAVQLPSGDISSNDSLVNQSVEQVTGAIRKTAGVKVRQIWRSRQPIASLLVPGDVVVEIRVLEVREPAIDQPRFAELQTYQYTDDVLLVRELDRRPVLVSNGSWIRTRVGAVVERAYKTKNLGAAAGATVEYDYDGGEMTINGVLVKTMHEPVFRDRRQLVAFRLYDPPFGGGIYLQPIKLFGVSDEGTLQPWQFRDGIPSPPSKLYGVHLDEIENELRKVR